MQDILATAPSPALDEAPLTGLERELLNYVIRLTRASEDSAAQFAALEQRSTAQISTRLDVLQSCVSSLLRSQTMLISAFAKSVSGSAGSSILPSGWSDMAANLMQADSRLSTPRR